MSRSTKDLYFFAFSPHSIYVTDLWLEFGAISRYFDLKPSNCVSPLALSVVAKQSTAHAVSSRMFNALSHLLSDNRGLITVNESTTSDYTLDSMLAISYKANFSRAQSSDGFTPSGICSG